MSIGTQLRQAREAQEISLDQAAQATHIRLRYLEALEADQYHLLPSSAQVRGFIRAYGEYLKLNSTELLLALDGDWKASQITEIFPTTSQGLSPDTTNSDAIFEEIGQKLKSQRELMGLSLGDVERHTHIRMHYVQALEEGDISHLPSPVQGRGMLSNYAAFLGLNSEVILLRFADGLQASLYDRQATRNPSQTKPHQGETNGTPTKPSILRRLFSMDIFASGLLIVFLLGFTIWGALRISALRSNQEPSPTSLPVSEVLLSTPSVIISSTLTVMPTNVLSTTVTAVVEASVVAETTQVVQTETTVVVESTPGSSNAPIQVYIVASQRSWLRITVDGVIAYEDRTMPGSAYSFSGNEQVDLLTGNGGGLHAYFNQQDLGVLGSFGEVVERVFSIQGVMTATPGVLPTSTPAPTGTPTPSSSAIPSNTPATPLTTPQP
jgi:cytoskeleton protein RodZ